MAVMRAVFLAALAGLGSGCKTAPSPATLSGRPNILLITADDLNWNSVGAFGCPIEDITPSIDELARQGMMFHNAHVNTAVCQPVRSLMMTGLYPHANGAIGFGPVRSRS